jgi:hypothetical protein
MTNLLTQNAKIKRLGKRAFNFGIPAGKSSTGFVTCPMAGECLKGCYASQGFYFMPTVKNAQEARLALTRSNDFIQAMTREIESKSAEIVRIHDSGDFYSPKYARDWFTIAKANPSVRFYAYTKMVKMIKALESEKPDNLTIIFSRGGKQDKLISSTDRHSRVFSSLEELKANGYSDASHDDSVAWGSDHKVGLIYHGSKGKAWVA